ATRVAIRSPAPTPVAAATRPGPISRQRAPGGGAVGAAASSMVMSAPPARRVAPRLPSIAVAPSTMLRLRRPTVPLPLRGRNGYGWGMTALPLNEILMLLAALTAAGLFGGLIAGLFGVGGGTVIVPAVFYAFEVLDVGGESNLHVAIGTSLLTIVATSWRSLRAHRDHGAVDETVLKTWTPWVGAGAVLGAAVAGVTSMEGLALVYGVCL